jgi:hypothetical protein
MTRRHTFLTLLTIPLLAATLLGCGPQDEPWDPSRLGPGKWVTWASNREDGRHEIYLMETTKREIKRLTATGGQKPKWAPDGRWIAYYHDGDHETRIVRPDGTGDRVACTGQIRYWHHDNSGFICRKGDGFYLVNPATDDATPWRQIYQKSDFTKLAGKVFDTTGATHDGRYILAVTDQYRNGYSGTNGAFKADWAAVAFDMQHLNEIHYVGAGCQPTTPSSGNWVYHVQRATTTSPDLARLDIRDLKDRSSYTLEMSHTNSDWGHEYFPSPSNDNKWMIYGASTGCHDFDTCDYELFLHPLGAGSAARERLTNHTANDRWPTIFVVPEA